MAKPKKSRSEPRERSAGASKPYVSRTVYFASRDVIEAVERAAAEAGVSPSKFIEQATEKAIDEVRPRPRCEHCGQVIAA